MQFRHHFEVDSVFSLNRLDFRMQFNKKQEDEDHTTLRNATIYIKTRMFRLSQKEHFIFEIFEKKKLHAMPRTNGGLFKRGPKPSFLRISHHYVEQKG